QWPLGPSPATLVAQNAMPTHGHRTLEGSTDGDQHAGSEQGQHQGDWRLLAGRCECGVRECGNPTWATRGSLNASADATTGASADATTTADATTGASADATTTADATTGAT